MTVGSATGAAQMLNVTQPAVTRLIQTLEHSVGFKLFERRNSRLVPTAEGRRLFAEVERTFLGLDHIVQAAAAIKTSATGTLRIASTPLFAHGPMPRIIGEFLRTFPGIAVEMTHGSRRYVIDCVASQAFDIAIETPPITDTGVDTELLTRRTAMCALPNDHPLAGKDEIFVEDLAGVDFIAPESDSIFRSRIDKAFRNAGIEPVVRLATATQKSICNMVAQGIGIGIVSPYVIEDAVGLPITFRAFRPVIPVEYALLFPSTRARSIIVERFVRLLKEQVSSRIAGGPEMDRPSTRSKKTTSLAHRKKG